jgi:hypothetical protein
MSQKENYLKMESSHTRLWLTRNCWNGVLSDAERLKSQARRSFIAARPVD